MGLIQNSTVIGRNETHVEIDESMFSCRKNQIGGVLRES